MYLFLFSICVQTDLPSGQHVESVAPSMVEPVVCLDWEHAFVECSAKDNADVVRVFQVGTH